MRLCSRVKAEDANLFSIIFIYYYTEVSGEKEQRVLHFYANTATKIKDPRGESRAKTKGSLCTTTCPATFCLPSALVVWGGLCVIEVVECLT